MSAIDETLRANHLYSLTFSQKHLPRAPQRKLAVLCCMDCRIDVETILGLRPGDAHILRNAGAIVTEDVIRSLIISHELLGTEEIMIIGHTGCGMTGFQDNDLKARLRAKTGKAAVAPQSFGAFSSVEESVREQMQKAAEHPWLVEIGQVRGFVYNVESGLLQEVPAQSPTLSYDLPPLNTVLEETA